MKTKQYAVEVLEKRSHGRYGKDVFQVWCLSETSKERAVEFGYEILAGMTYKEIIKDFVKKFNLKNLYPNEKNYQDFQPWKNIILGGISQIGERDVILAVQGKKPCGVMAFYEQDKQINLTHLAKWRASSSSDTKFVGKILMHHLFDVAGKKDALNISLYPSYCEPRGKNCKPFYLDLGFRHSAGGSLNLFGVNYAQKAAQLEYFFDYKKLKDQSYVDAKKQAIIDKAKSMGYSVEERSENGAVKLKLVKRVY